MLGRAKSKTPLVTEEELDCWEWIYSFEEMWDIDDEFDYCLWCGHWVSKYVPEHRTCECGYNN